MVEQLRAAGRRLRQRRGEPAGRRCWPARRSWSPARSTASAGRRPRRPSRPAAARARAASSKKTFAVVVGAEPGAVEADQGGGARRAGARRGRLRRAAGDGRAACGAVGADRSVTIEARSTRGAATRRQRPWTAGRGQLHVELPGEAAGLLAALVELPEHGRDWCVGRGRTARSAAPCARGWNSTRVLGQVERGVEVDGRTVPPAAGVGGHDVLRSGSSWPSMMSTPR